MASNYEQGRHFILTSSDEIVEMLFADDFDEEVDKLDSEDFAVLTEANELGKNTVVISTEDVDHEHTTSFSMWFEPEIEPVVLTRSLSGMAWNLTRVSFSSIVSALEAL